MHKNTRIAYNAYTAQLATLNDTGSATDTFSVVPSVQQRLETKIQESSAFLSKVNIIGVTEQEGDKLGLGIASPIASRTDTNKTERQTRDPSSLDSQRYRCEKTNFDTHIAYAKLDAWAKFHDFQSRIANQILNRQGIDRMVIGFNGVSVAPDTDLNQYPLLQDVNKGWLQHYRDQAPARVMGSGIEDNKVTIGPGGDYANLDAAVFDALNLLDPWCRNDTGLVVIVSRQLLSDKYFPAVNIQQAPSETLAADIIMSQKRIGGLPAVTVPYFPDNAIFITRYDNLSIYYQEGARRRRVVDSAKRDRIENYESSNDAYVVEDFGMGALIENIRIITALPLLPAAPETPGE